MLACNWVLMNRVDYSEPKVIKNILFNYNELMKLALKGDQVAAIICVDLKQAVHADKVLTFKQRRYLGLWWQGFNTIEIAAMYHKDPSVVNRVICGGFARISKFLTKKIHKTPSEMYIVNGEGYIS